MIQLAAEQRPGVPPTRQLPQVPGGRAGSGEAYAARAASHAEPASTGNKTRTWLIILLLLGALILGVLTALVIRQLLLT